MLKNKICFIASVLGQGGAERQLYYILKTLKSLGADCYLICFTQSDYWEQPIRNLGVKVLYIKENHKLLKLLKIISLIRKYKFEVIQSAHFQINLYIAIASLGYRVKHIGAIRNNLISEIRVLGPLGWFCFHLPNFLVANSKKAFQTAIKMGKPNTQLFYLPNVVDEQLFFPKDHEYASKKLKGIFLGTLWAPKRVDRIIQLAQECKNNDVPIEFLIYGDGILRNKLMEDAQTRGVLNTNLYFMGATIDSTKALQSGDFLILTSDYEGTPNVVLEAMSCGLAVVSTDVGDVAALVDNGINGFVVPLESPEKLYDAVIELSLNPGMLRKMKRTNREKIVSTRSISILKEYLTVLYSTVGVIKK